MCYSAVIILRSEESHFKQTQCLLHTGISQDVLFCCYSSVMMEIRVESLIADTVSGVNLTDLSMDTVFIEYCRLSRISIFMCTFRIILQRDFSQFLGLLFQ